MEYARRQQLITRLFEVDPIVTPSTAFSALRDAVIGLLEEPQPEKAVETQHEPDALRESIAASIHASSDLTIPEATEITSRRRLFEMSSPLSLEVNG